MALMLEVKVVPSSGRHKWALESSGRLKCYLKNPPEDGLANKELIKLLADALKIHRSDIFIVSGLTSRLKRIKIDTALEHDQLLKILGLEVQHGLF